MGCLCSFLIPKSADLINLLMNLWRSHDHADQYRRRPSPNVKLTLFNGRIPSQRHTHCADDQRFLVIAGQQSILFRRHDDDDDEEVVFGFGLECRQSSSQWWWWPNESEIGTTSFFTWRATTTVKIVVRLSFEIRLAGMSEMRCLGRGAEKVVSGLGVRAKIYDNICFTRCQRLF